MSTQAIKDAVAGIKAAFGAPGDYGYDTKEGKALYALYRAAAAAPAQRVANLEDPLTRVWRDPMTGRDVAEDLSP